MKKVCILGAGSWGTALAIHLALKHYRVTLWGRPEDDIDQIKEKGENQHFLPGVKLPDRVYPETDLQKALKNTDMVVLAVPSQALRDVLGSVQPYLTTNTRLVNTAKGLELSSGLRMSQVVQEVLGAEYLPGYAVLSGPSHAEEVGRQIPTAVTVAAYNKETAFLVQNTFMSGNFRVYTNPDVSGVELGGALKNIIALATGILYGLEYGDNTAAALMTRGLAEMTRMGVAMGGDQRTFYGLSGIGDLVVTCSSQHSRNRRAGEMIGQGQTLEQTMQNIGMVVEGAYTTRVVHHLATRMNIDMPITTACYRVLYEGRNPRHEVEKLMKRQKKHEMEETVTQNIDW
ncbi:Glycerol-3-phosphate dehydrogenase, NAD-dependent [Syntrophomonas zehnderi OL-4]|uniref:Glycerol-3-phosphate dehydrogenase [NAD(P)+] n=1 Tax=Syntrophomonas zehnderi OL-4 TaxID=690567 RepID=A0A0E4C807_9FIRM|nr:NAD(P)H-dependent glycerol-3-phosphate dehydrogenase [Syntrophomonas zehnderi]CFX20912.1 Glycerol-3-phosphate dehydrogenase, NAD-dependent [Syntrophomonas zehnderi OL-4]